MNDLTNKNNLFPVFLKLESLRLLLVGAGPVATEKLTAVLANAPKTSIKIVAKEVSEPIANMIAGKANILLVQKEFDASDLNDIDLVIAAVGNREVASQIREQVHERNLLVNVADTPDLCDFYLGSIVQKGNLKIAISTNGQSPTAAKRIKEMLNNALPDEIDEMIDNLHAIRNQLKGDFQNKVNKMNEITKGLIE
jgi:siroheme synthase-like protein